MKSTGRTVWSPFVRAIFVAVVVACLCFSAGEGLRLTPLPSPTPAGEAGPPDTQPFYAFSRGVSLNRTGPLAAPSKAQTQKRGKRQAPDCDFTPPDAAREIVLGTFSLAGAVTQLDRASRPAHTRPPGRAPPLAS